MIRLFTLDFTTLNMMHNGTDYFDLHLTPDDIFDRVVPEHIGQN
jgi:hypothetical protein